MRQLIEKGYEINQKKIYKIKDDKSRVIDTIHRMTKNRMFSLNIHIGNQTCFSSIIKDKSWSFIFFMA